MTYRARALAISFLIAGALSSMLAAGDSDKEPVLLKPADLTWEERSSGVKVAVLQKDPEKEGPFRCDYIIRPGSARHPTTIPGMLTSPCSRAATSGDTATVSTVRAR